MRLQVDTKITEIRLFFANVYKFVLVIVNEQQHDSAQSADLLSTSCHTTTTYSSDIIIFLSNHNETCDYDPCKIK